MAKKQGGGELLPLPFTTFGELEPLGLKATVYCAGCYGHRSIDPTAEHLRARCFATTRFRCTQIRYTGNVCGCLGSVEIEPAVLLPVGGEDTLAFLSCSTCLPSWEINHVPIDQPVPAQKYVRPRKQATADGEWQFSVSRMETRTRLRPSHCGWAVGAIAFERRVCRT
jgi:hypothetical protein